MIVFMRGLVGICLLFSLAVEAAPTSARSSFAVTTLVRSVDCRAVPVKKKACAPVLVSTETSQAGYSRTAVTIEAPQAEKAGNVLTTVFYY
jgi:hypothetical protein